MLACGIFIVVFALFSRKVFAFLDKPLPPNFPIYDLFYKQNKSLLRAIIKKIEVQPNHKDIKRITYWFDYDNAQDDYFLVSKERRTVSQIRDTVFYY